MRGGGQVTGRLRGGVKTSPVPLVLCVCVREEGRQAWVTTGLVKGGGGLRL